MTKSVMPHSAFVATHIKHILWASICVFLFGLVGCQTAPNKYYGKISEDGSGVSLENRQKMFVEYNNRGDGGYQYTFVPTDRHRPRQLNYSRTNFPPASDQIKNTSLVSYMVYEDDSVMVDLTSPPERFGTLLDANPSLYSMSLGKSLTGYFVAHAICEGYIESLDQKLSDWPLVADTFIAEASLRDVINASMGHQFLLKNNEEFHSGRFVNGTLKEMIESENMKGSKPDEKGWVYGQLPPFIALNYVAFKTNYSFRKFSNNILQNHIGIAERFRWAHKGGGFEQHGNIHPNFNATREDMLRIGIAILEDWNKDNCVGTYLKNMYSNRVQKRWKSFNNDVFGTGFGRSRAYAGFFHTDYQSVDDTIMGMDGYGGISMLINFDKNRIVYAHAVARDYDHQKLIFDVISQGL